MEVMYLKYTHGIRHSIIKEGENIIITNSKIIPFKPAKTVVNKSTLPLNSKEDNVNEKITNFFFDAIHKNYLSSRKNSNLIL